MLPYTEVGTGETTLVLFHFFGGSRREWVEVMGILSERYRCIAVDMPGFGSANSVSGYTVEQMADQVCALVESLGLERFVLVGHSMSGKISLAIAKREPAGLSGLVLIAPSPPSPEPISEANRDRMRQMSRSRESAEEYVDSNVANRLPPPLRERAIEDFLRAAPEAWLAWLDHGSKEDWSARVGTIEVPTLVVAGEKDASLPADVQERLTLPHLKRARLEVIPTCGHLAPLERPEYLSDLLGRFVDALQ